MSLKGLIETQKLPGKVISVAVSQQGDLYAGWSNGSIMTLPRGSNALSVYVKGTQSTLLPLVSRRTPRSEFAFVKPICIDAWGANYSQYVGDAEMNCIFEIRSDEITLVAGTGQNGNDDGDGLTEATFDSIRSVSVYPQYIAVLCNGLDGLIRLINRTTNRVTSLPKFPNVARPIHLLNAAQYHDAPNCFYVVGNFTGLSTRAVPGPESSAKCVDYQGTRIFDSPSFHIDAWKYLSTRSFFEVQMDGLRHVPISPSFIDDVLPAYCPLSDMLFAVKEGKLCIFVEFSGRNQPKGHFSIEFEDASILLDPCGLKPDLEFTHKASNTTFGILRSVIERQMQGPSSMAAERLALFVTSSKHPVATISRFIEHLYFKPLDDVDLQQLITLAWISKQVYGQEDPIIIKALQRRIECESNTAVFDLLTWSWMNLTEPFELDGASPIVKTLLQRVQLDQCRRTHDAVKKMPSGSTSSRLTSLLALVALYSPVVTLPVHQAIDRFSPNEVTSTPHFLSLYSTNFVIELPAVGSFGVCGWLLYVHWPWFKGLVDSGLQESKTRIITLPSNSFTGLALKAVIAMLQSGHMDAFDRLNKIDAISLLKHASAFGLTYLDGKRLLRTQPLIEACEEKVFPTLSCFNCWDQLRLAYSIGASYYQTILNAIPTLATKIELDDLTDLPPQVAYDLTQMLHRKRMAAMRRLS